MNNTSLVLEIKGNSLDDGPGIRSVVFFKGCPLDCVWCHNPESKRKEVEISFDAGECIACDSCIEACPEEALSRENIYFINRDKCTLCFSCESVCPTGALSRVGTQMSVEEIIGKIKKDKPFFKTSGGGATLSGGEPTLNIDFTSELMQGLKNEGIQTLIETCGFFKQERFMEKIYPNTDLIYFDIKIMDKDDHIKYCGVPNDIILKNFIKLHEEFLRGGVEILPRTPLIPDITDTDQNLKAIVDFYNTHKVRKTALLSYNPLWHEKNSKIGIDNSYSNKEKMHKWTPSDKENHCRKIFLDAGIELI